MVTRFGGVGHVLVLLVGVGDVLDLVELVLGGHLAGTDGGGGLGLLGGLLAGLGGGLLGVLALGGSLLARSLLGLLRGSGLGPKLAGLRLHLLGPLLGRNLGLLGLHELLVVLLPEAALAAELVSAHGADGTDRVLALVHNLLTGLLDRAEKALPVGVESGQLGGGDTLA